MAAYGSAVEAHLATARAGLRRVRAEDLESAIADDTLVAPARRIVRIWSSRQPRADGVSVSWPGAR